MRARQEPTFEQVPPCAYTDGEMACRLAAAYFGEPLPWQRHVLDVMLARDGDDRYASHAVALAVPRQNGKSWAVLARCLYGIVAAGESVLYTCQLSDTADGMFARLCGPFEADDADPELVAMLDHIRKANGQQAIVLRNGGGVRFTTRTARLARGRDSYDVVVYDEAQTLTRAQQAASMPTVSASKTHNSQIVYLGTPPDPDTNGFVFEQMRAKARAGELPDVAWMEWSAPEVGDVSDRARWYETNPSLGELVDETAVEGELTMTREDFARERLGWWSPVAAAAPVVPQGAWEATAIGAIGSLYRRKTALAVRFSPDGSAYAVAGAKANARGEAAFELASAGTTERGVAGLAQALHERRRKVACVVVDGRGGADALCERLSQLGCPRGYVVRPRLADVVAASQGLLDALRQGDVRHTSGGGQAALDRAAATATARMVGRDGGWAFDGEGAEAMQACALALWGLRTTKRDPRRRQRLL